MSESKITTGNLIDHYVRRMGQIAARESKAFWELGEQGHWARTLVHQHFMHSLGLSPLPARCKLRATVTGTFRGPGYVGSKLAYQFLPDCWGSANLYRPDSMGESSKIPAVLYACGHDLNGVHAYQHHGIAWAQRGYACLIFETLEQSDNPGDHHVLNRGDAPGWMASQYSAAGAEVWNGMRALDLLLEQSGIDARRVGVTGISGGRAQAFFLACADDRLKAAACVGGISDPLYAIPTGQVQQHCDCMYLRNTYGHDLSLFAALIAPRALLMCFARGDQYFSLREFHQLHERCRARFEKMQVPERCALFEYEGPHGYNTRATYNRIHEWFDQYVAGEPHPEVDTLALSREPAHDERTLSVFNGTPPQPNRVSELPRILPTQPQVLALPESLEQWRKDKWKVQWPLMDQVFHSLQNRKPEFFEIEQIGNWQVGNGHARAWRGNLEGMSLRFHSITPANDGHDTVLVAVGRRTQTALQLAREIFVEAQNANLGVLAIEPRARGVNAFSAEHRTYLNRMGCLAGQTPTMMMVEDLRRACDQWGNWPGISGKKLVFVGIEEGAIAVLVHALMHTMMHPNDEMMAGVILCDLPSSFLNTPHQIMGSRASSMSRRLSRFWHRRPWRWCGTADTRPRGLSRFVRSAGWGRISWRPITCPWRCNTCRPLESPACRIERCPGDGVREGFEQVLIKQRMLRECGRSPLSHLSSVLSAQSMTVLALGTRSNRKPARVESLPMGRVHR